ncbi:MAG TPA: hypothetical protein PLD62_06095, partial [Candidatus Cloacimonadota bacterium]|nr:hypothetical protein [Candidatus Cloacimonadota bacterium]
MGVGYWILSPFLTHRCAYESSPARRSSSHLPSFPSSKLPSFQASHLPNFSSSPGLIVTKSQSHLISFFIILHFTLFIFHSSIAQAIEVSGHLTENTTWSPDNNPYEVVDNVFVEAGVTLTILPGTEVKIQSAQLTCSDDFYDNFWYRYGANVAKMIWVNGNIIAKGTEQDSIVFTRLQDDFNYYWGCVYIPGDGIPKFEHCIVEYSGGMGIAVGNVADAAISIYNDTGKINHCTFRNNCVGLYVVYTLTHPVEIIDCAFYNDNINYYVLHRCGCLHLVVSQPAENHKPALVAHNYFSGCYVNVLSAYYVDNTNISCIQTSTGVQYERTSYFYDNSFTSCQTGIYGGHFGDSIFIKNNRFINGNDGLDLDEAYVEISDNHFSGCGIDLLWCDSGKIFN